MGALLDPVVDRLTILSGAAVCWHFELLPRWALAVLVARELVMLLMAQYAVRHGQDLEINWYGRIAVFPIMGAIFWAMVVESVVWDVMLITGVALAVIATIAYARTGLRRAGCNRTFNPWLSERSARPIIDASSDRNERTTTQREEGLWTEDTTPNIGSMSDEELKELIDKLTSEEQEVSYRRRILHGQIDILRAELVNRLRDHTPDGESLIKGDDVERLSEILAGKHEAPTKPPS